MRPAPMSNGSAAVAPSSFLTPLVLAVVISADLIIAGVQVGCSAIKSAADPAECGLDMEVPLSTPYSGGAGEPRLAIAAQISTPGPVMSGLRVLVRLLGPRELKLAMMSPLAAP